MKISKQVFINILAKYFIKILGIPEQLFNRNSAVQAVKPSFEQFAPNLKKENILSDDGMIDVLLLEKKVIQFFSLVPILRIPAKNMSINITEEMARSFIQELKANCEPEEVICLPCQK